MDSPPPLSVLLTVYNGKRYVLDAINSILAQTHREFELLIINDGSTDGSSALLAAQRDERIRLIHHESNQGLIATLNHGLAVAKGRWLALMDYDDVAKPHRLERQVQFMTDHPDIASCGSMIETFGQSTGPGWVRYTSPEDIAVALLFENPLCHPSMMHDRRALQGMNLRYPNVLYAEDYALWSRLARRARIANIPETLLQYRTHDHQISQQRSEQQAAAMAKIIRDQLAGLEVTPSARDLLVHQILGASFTPLPGYARRIRLWTQRLLQANARTKIYEQTTLKRQLEARLHEAIARTRSQLNSMSGLRRFKWRLIALRQYLAAA
jgi:hypothetical protein